MPQLIAEKTPWGKFLGNPVRKLSRQGQKRLYLSFDDGPNRELTPAVLDLLAELGVRATFFVVAERAWAHPDLIARIQTEGHALGNHSLDHRYSVFFKGYDAMKEWIERAEAILKDLKVQSVGFRPPVGIRTPKLVRVLREKKLPLILWKQRCYDTAIKFSPSRAEQLAGRSRDGDIILLHDRQRPEWKDSFLSSLRTFIAQAQAREFSFAILPAAY